MMRPIKKIVELVINHEELDTEEAGVSVVSIVDAPAIEVDFFAFKKAAFESYTDYPEAATENAKRALRYAEENGWGSCGTPVGKARANQLANREPISEDTIARMASFERQRQNSDRPLGEGCGRLMWLAWGGDEGVEWAQRKLSQIRSFEIEPNDQEMIDGIVEILVQIEDVVNRAEVADKVMQDLVAQGIDYNSDLFLNRVGLKFADEKHEHHILTAEQEEGILKMAAELGEDLNPAAHWLELGKTEFATLGDYLKGLAGLDALSGNNRSTVTKYQYAGPSAERNFCKAMLRLNRLYTRDDLRQMAAINMSEYISTGERSTAHSADANPLLDWKSGVNCRHYWNEIQVITQQDGQEIYINKGPARGAAGLSNNVMSPSPNGAVPDNARFTRIGFAVENEDQRIIIAPAMIPNKFILRKDEETGELYYVYFTKKTIREIAERFFKKSYQNNTDVNHNGNVVGHNTLLESWIIDDTKFDKSNSYGFNLPVGTWMLSYRINNEETWQQIKQGRLNGLSVEGMFIELH